MAKAYAQKRKGLISSVWNDYLEAPAMEGLLRPLVKGKAVLDLGSGLGSLTEKLLDWGVVPKGIDISEKMVSLSREAFPKVPFL